MSFKPSGKLILAGAIAACADLVQALLPFSSLGFLDPVNDFIDFIVGGIMVALLGWHWVFMPSFMGKITPLVDVCPLWTMAVFFVGWGQSGQPTPPQQAMPGGIMPPPSFIMPIHHSTAPTQPQKEITMNAATPAQAQH